VQASVLCVTTGMGMVYSVLVLDAKNLGATAFMAGIVLAAFGGIRFLANVPTGIASERFGRRQVALCGLAIAAFASFLAAVSHDLTSLLVWVFCQGLGIGAYNTASLSAIADLGTPASRVRDMAAYQGTFLFGLSLGPAIAGAAATYWGYAASFFLMGVLAVIAMLILYGLAETEHRQSAKFNPKLLARLAGPAAMTYSVIFARGVSVWVLLPIIAKHDFAMSVGAIGLLLTAGSAANLAVLPIAAPIARRYGRTPMMIGAALIIVAALGLLAINTSPLPLWLASILLGAGSGLALPLSIACAADLAPAGQTGAAMGVMRSVTDLGMLTGPVFVGAAIDHLSHGEQGGVAICALLLIASTMWFAAVTARPVPRPAPSTSNPAGNEVRTI
jgi:MFS family permease